MVELITKGLSSSSLRLVNNSNQLAHARLFAPEMWSYFIRYCMLYYFMQPLRAAGVFVN